MARQSNQFIYNFRSIRMLAGYLPRAATFLFALDFSSDVA